MAYGGGVDVAQHGDRGAQRSTIAQGPTLMDGKGLALKEEKIGNFGHGSETRKVRLTLLAGVQAE